MSVRGFAVLAAGALAASLAIAPATALAAPTALLAGTVLTVTGDASAETFTIAKSGTNVQVSGPAGMPDPDGAGINCNATGGGSVVSCADAAVEVVYVKGGAGNDTLTKGAAGSYSQGLDGGGDDDTLNAGDGRLNGGDNGGPGNDTYNGSAQRGDEFLGGEPGADTYNAGTRIPQPNEDGCSFAASADAAQCTPPDPDEYQRSLARDTIDYSSVDKTANITLDGQANDGLDGENDNVKDMEHVSGGDKNDTLTAGAAAVQFDGGAGDDRLTGSPAGDRLYGGSGSDVIIAGAGNDGLQDGDFTPAIHDPGDPPLPAAGNDTLDAGPGNDELQSDSGSDNLIGGPGQDYVQFDRPITQASTVTTPVQATSFEISFDDQANDGAKGSGETGNVHSDIEGLGTGNGDDTVRGGPAAEDIFTSGGNDTIDPGAGVDRVSAGRGDDTVKAVDSTTDVVDCGSGNDNATVDLPGGQPARADVTLDCEALGGTAFPPPVTPTPLPDLSAVKLALSVKTIKSKAFLKNGLLTITLTCDKACSATAEAFSTAARLRKVGQLSIGSGQLGLGSGKRTLKVKVAKKYLTTYKRKLRTKPQKKKGIKFPVAITVTSAVGIKTTSTKTVTVKG
jgi:Ca2+-binding RTX toxin-like protein